MSALQPLAGPTGRTRAEIMAHAMPDDGCMSHATFLRIVLDTLGERHGAHEMHSMAQGGRVYVGARTFGVPDGTAFDTLMMWRHGYTSRVQPQLWYGLRMHGSGAVVLTHSIMTIGKRSTLTSARLAPEIIEWRDRLSEIRDEQRRRVHAMAAQSLTAGDFAELAIDLVRNEAISGRRIASLIAGWDAAKRCSLLSLLQLAALTHAPADTDGNAIRALTERSLVLYGTLSGRLIEQGDDLAGLG